MRKIFQNRLKYILFLAIGVATFYYIYRDFDFAVLQEQLSNDFQYRWVILAMFMAIMSHLFRSLRWNLVLDTDTRKVKKMNSFLSVMSSYFMNLIVPRMGEISRCASISKTEKISFTEALGTVISERIIDMIMLMILTLVVVIGQSSKLMDFIHQNPEIGNKITHFILNPFVISVLALLGIASIYLGYKLLKSERLKKIALVQSFFQGVMSIKNIQHPWRFITYTLAIWFLYFAMDYVCFFAFDFSSDLSIMAGITVFIFGSYGMVAPVQGGMGPWHFMTVEALALYNIDKTDGLIFALVVHTAITLITFITGGICALVLPFVTPNEKTK